MDWNVAFKIIFASLASVGISGAIIFALSSWLGKVWAQRILQTEQHELTEELEKTKRDLDIIKETTLRFQNDKILIYRAIVDVVSDILSSFDSLVLGRLSQEEADNRFHEFNRNRMKVYGYLAMLAPQEVMDAQDQLMDHLMLIYNGTEHYDWQRVRELAINLLNTVRVDIGIDENPIEYRGVL